VVSWDQHFDRPVVPPAGKPLKTLRDAGHYIGKLSRSQQAATAWQTAAHCLIEAADNGGPVAFARIGMMQALFPKSEPAFDKPRKTTPWRRRGLARDG
jgi:hypothetical protein